MPLQEPLAQVPDGFDPWLRTLLHMDPAGRFQRAVGAAWALRGIDDRGLSDADVMVLSTFRQSRAVVLSGLAGSSDGLGPAVARLQRLLRAGRPRGR